MRIGFGRPAMMATILALLIAVTGCAGKSTIAKVTSGAEPVPQGNSQASRDAKPDQATPEFQQCGKDMNRYGEGYDAKARDCLWQAVSDGRPAEFTR